MARPRTGLLASISTLLRGGFGASRAENSLQSGNGWLDESLAQAASATGLTVTPLKAAGVATVFSCINSVSRSVASIPLKLYRKVPGGGKEVATDHPLYALLHDAPNEEMTSSEFRRAVQANATLRNVAYALIVRNGLGEVAELWPIANKDLAVERNAATKALQYVLTQNGKNSIIPASSILRVSGLTDNGVTALDPVSTVREVIGLAMALQEHGARYFSNGASLGGFLETPATLQPAQIEKLREEYDKKHTGVRNSHRPMIGYGGMKWSSTAGSNEASQFIEARRYQDEAIAKVFGVPPHKVGDLSRAHFSNVENENQNYVTDTLLPWCTSWTQSLNQKLLTPAERRVYSFEFVFEGLLRGDIQTRFQAYSIARQWGWMNVNEIRERENLNPVEGGEVFLQPMNMELAGTTQEQRDAEAARVKQQDAAA